jgi:hypothetical protein
MFKPAEVPNWVVLIYERQPRFRPEIARQMITDLVKTCEEFGKEFTQGRLPLAVLNPGRDHHQSPASAHEMGIGPRGY